MVGLLTLDRLAGEVVMPPDEPRRCIPAPQGQHKAPGDLAPARVSRPAGSRRMGGLAACLVSRGGHDRPPRRGWSRVCCDLMTASGEAIVEAVLVQLPLAAISLYVAARAQWSLPRGLTTARAGV